MAYGIMSEDFLAVCLLFAKGEIHMPMGEVITRIQAFQQKTDREFGESEADVFNLFYGMGWTAGGDRWKWETFASPSEDPFEIFDGIFLKDFITPALRYHNVYFNDEGEWWEIDEQRRPTRRNLLMRELLMQGPDYSPEELLSLLSLYGWDCDLVKSCLVGGDYRWFDEWRWFSPGFC